MKILFPDSLTATLGALDEAFFRGQSLPHVQRAEVVAWLVSRQDQTGPDAGTFAPTETDHMGNVRLYSGERLKTHFAAGHILSAEAARALLLLDAPTPGAQEAIRRTDQRLRQACFAMSCIVGECAHATISLMRYLAVGGLDDVERRLNAHLETLSQQRDGQGRWRRFPFYYTLLALSEIDLPLAVQERQYAAPACERYLRRATHDDAIGRRRRAIMQRSLAKS
jgi:hypothetical protein